MVTINIKEDKALKKITRTASAICAAAVVLVLGNPAFAGCDKELVDADLQVATGLSTDEIRKLIASVTPPNQDEEKLEQASSN